MVYLSDPKFQKVAGESWDCSQVEKLNIRPFKSLHGLQKEAYSCLVSKGPFKVMRTIGER